MTWLAPPNLVRSLAFAIMLAVPLGLGALIAVFAPLINPFLPAG